MDETLTSKRFYKWLLFITIFAAVLRFLWLTKSCLWVDELYSVRDAAWLFQDPLVNFFKKVRVVGYLPIALGLLLNGFDLSQIDITTPETWLTQGITAWPIRIVPACIGILTIPILAIASRKILKDRTVLILALLLAVAPWHIYWSQTGRFYITQFLFYNLALIYYFRATWEGSKLRLLLAMGCFILAFACQYTSAVLLLIVGGDWLLSKLRRDRLQLDWTEYLILGFSLLLGMGMVAWAILKSDHEIPMFIALYSHPPLWHVMLLITCIGPIVMVVALYSQFTHHNCPRRLLNYLFLAAVLPMIAYSFITFRDHFRPRYTFICYYPWLALAAISLTHMYEKLRLHIGKIYAWAPVALFSVWLLLVQLNNTFYKAGLRTRWDETADYIRMHYQPGEKVVFNARWMGVYFLSDLVGTVFMSPEEIVEVNEGVWIVTRDKGRPYKPMLRHPVLSQAKLQKTISSYNRDKRRSIIQIYYFPKR